MLYRLPKGNRPVRAMPAAAFALATGLFLANSPVLAQTASANGRIAPDLASVIALPTMPSNLRWATTSIDEITRVSTNLVKVLIVSSSSDPTLASLRQDVLSHGGSLYYVYDSVRAMSALLPASYVTTIAARSDVQLVMPNRTTARTSSLLQQTSGSAVVPALATGAAVDGKGVGIAVLDSGIAWFHQNMLDSAGRSRVAQAVDIVQFSNTRGMGGWARSMDYTAVTSAFIWTATQVPMPPAPRSMAASARRATNPRSSPSARPTTGTPRCAATTWWPASARAAPAVARCCCPAANAGSTTCSSPTSSRRATA